MERPTVILDVSKALGFDFLYHPFIGKISPNPYPLIAVSFQSKKKLHIKKIL